MSKAYALVFDGYADWELGFVLPELRRLCKLEVVTVGFDKKPVVSMGGLKVIPDTVISEVELDDVRLFIVPGGFMWEGSYPAEIEKLLHRIDQAGKPIAAICAATLMIARAGLLRSRKHSSNSLAYLTQRVPEYTESANYVDALTTRDQHLITASGLGALELAVAIFDELDLVSPEIKKGWYNALKHGIFPENYKQG